MTRAAGFASAGTRTFKNAMIGGDFSTNPWQRGTSSTPAVSSTTWLADRWLIASLMSTGQFLNRSTTDVPTADEAGVAATLAYELAASVAEASPGAGAYYGLQQRIEGYNIAHLGFGEAGTRYLTLSFWHKHTKTGTYSVTFRNSAGNRSYAAEYTQAVTNTWEKAEITVPVDTSGTWVTDNGIGLQVYFAFVTGTNYQGTPGAWAAANYLGSTNQVNALDSLSNYCRIALVQLEAGPEATEFEARDVGTELALCQRYYCKSYTQGTNPGTATTVGQREIYLTGFNAAAHFVRFDQPFPTTMRTTPSVTAYSPSTGTANKVYDLASVGDVNASVTHISDVSFCGGGTTASSATANISFHWKADAEL